MNIKKYFYLFFIVLILVPFSSANWFSPETPPSLTKTYLDNYYCQLNGDCILNSLIVFNLTSITNYNASGKILINDYLGRSYTTLEVINTTTHYNNSENGSHNFIGSVDIQDSLTVNSLLIYDNGSTIIFSS